MGEVKNTFEGLAQKNSYAKRRFVKDKEITSGIGNLDIELMRNEFSRDRDRILFSRAFRRLVHKAQIHPFESGDHFRTRLTHTIEVSQIARSIARNLGLNEDLTEAIAVGHDVGHTPFGHQGEDVLHDVLSGKDDLDGEVKYKIDFGGFKHNFNSIHILDVIEKKYADFNGLNLTWQVLEGILKHTGTKRNGRAIDIKRFVNTEVEDNKNELFFLDRCFSVTLEGQIVFLADEIAQRQHDLDDGFREKEINLDANKVMGKIIEFIDESVDSAKKKGSVDEDSLKLVLELETKLDELIRSDNNYLYKKNTLVGYIIDYFIKDLTMNSRAALNAINKDDYEKSDDRLVFNKRCINFSNIADKLNLKIEKYIFNKIINSHNINIFDEKAINVIRSIFKAYYRNPKQIPPYVLNRIKEGIKSNSALYDIKIKDRKGNEKSITEIGFQGDFKEIRNLVDILKLNIDEDKIVLPKGVTSITKEEMKKTLSKSLDDMDERDKFFMCLIENYYIFLANICDFIAGMTDNYAKEEYRKLFVV